MPLFDQSFTQIISGVAPINPGVGGWDVLLSQFMDDRRGRHGFGLLGRTLNIVPGTPTTASNLLTLPVGWSCLPILVALRRVTGATPGDYVYRCTGQEGDHEVWRAAQLVNTTLSPLRMTIQFADDIFAAVSGTIPWCDGDEQINPPVLSRNLFTVHRQTGSGSSTPVDFFVYGFSWQNDD